MEGKISTGSRDLDKWLKGGYEKDIITTLYGPAGTGKTNLCLIAAAEQAKQGKKVIYIDSEGGFSIERLKQLTSLNVIKNIILFKPTTFQEQEQAFRKMLQELKKEKQKLISLIIVDSIVMLYRLELGAAKELVKKELSKELKESKEKTPEEIASVNRAMARQLRILSEIARKKNIPIIVTNQVYSFDKKILMVGGDLLKYWSKCIIELKKENNKIKAILKKHRSLPESEFKFIITNNGISKASFKLF